MTSMRVTWALGTAALGAALWTAAPAPAHACGGCFAPSDTVTVVTAHRMAVAISPAETTLWDQIQYAGDPEDFVWVLPILGENLVELADNAFFEALDRATQITLQGTFPPLNTFCPDPCGGGDAGASFGGAGSVDAGTTVDVYGEAVVGPYETATIGSEDPDALVTWLRDNGYGVPDSILPVISHYVGLGLNFAVLRLNPNAGVNQMQPVRITTPGMMPVFPLRMVAAGVEGEVGLELYVLGEGRYEAQNFAVGEIDHDALHYDWDTGSFNYGDVFDRTLEELGGRAWIAEYAQPSERFSGTMEYYESYDDDGTLHTPEQDWDVVTRSLEQPYLTKLRTDLPASALDEDLVLQASTGGTIESFIQVSREINRPSEPSCPTVCTRGSDGPAADRERSSRHGLVCSAQPGLGSAGWLALPAGAALLLLVVARRRRR